MQSILMAIVAIIIMQSSALGQDWICGPQTVANNPGDLITWSWDIKWDHQQNFCDFSFYWSYGNGESVTILDRDCRGERRRETWQWTATSYNKSAGLYLTSGCFRHWTCTQSMTVTHITQPVNQPGDTIKKFIKDRAREKAGDFRNASDILNGVSAAAAAAGRVAVSLVALGQATLFSRAADRQKDIANDPPSECPGECEQMFSAYLHDPCEIGCYLSD